MKTKELLIPERTSDLEFRLDSESDKSSIERYTDWYFAPKSFERSGRLYESLGVKPFKKLVMGTVGRPLKRDQASNYFIGRPLNNRAMKRYELMTRLNETIHAPFTAFAIYIISEWIEKGNYGDVIFGAIPFLINGYSTMLQRYNRARIYETIKKREKKEK